MEIMGIGLADWMLIAIGGGLIGAGYSIYKELVKIRKLIEKQKVD